MTKKKTKAAKKNKSLLSGAAKSLRKLSTTKKVVGGSALLALGLGYLAQRRGLFSALIGGDTDANTGESLSSMEGARL
ncbi:hypothetical protein [Hymenobacter jeollabukensis]|uniref:Uncharacterized protein n=1 Tax=Hymenobacter jeollabukensis TaxID=2025313 RepID=A0A5R8WSG0_9BACT|nr:hypothetical protein [Hymenobacter jeollabukensis]TLM94092.1 hypothetical protein FDY95_08690 [Hymenobacter jeollabukensis]